jgi:propionyl-CoA carboxylase alpha chain
VSYLGAGTAEFLVSDGQFYFLEFNTRLQVEHPVTECVHGIDLVALQLGIAGGLALPPDPPPPAGHAIEARLYAEDPADGYRPSSGLLHALDVPDSDTRFAPPAAGTEQGLRLDSGVEAGSEITPHYDPMLAKLIAWAPARHAATRLLASALDQARIHGPATNRDLLVSVLRHPAFLAGQADTSLLDGYDLAGLVPSEETCLLAAAAAAVAGAAANRAAARAAAGLPGGWRNVASQPQHAAFDGPRGRIEVSYLWQRDGSLALPGRGDVAVAKAAPDHTVLDLAGVRYRFDVFRADDVVWVDFAHGSVTLTNLPRLPEPVAAREPGSLVAPMPGSVVRVEATAGQRVSAGQPVLVLEAMKMEHQIRAPADGLVAEVLVGPGDQVQAGDVLATVTEQDATARETASGADTARP